MEISRERSELLWFHEKRENFTYQQNGEIDEIEVREDIVKSTRKTPRKSCSQNVVMFIYLCKLLVIFFCPFHISNFCRHFEKLDRTNKTNKSNPSTSRPGNWCGAPSPTWGVKAVNYMKLRWLIWKTLPSVRQQPTTASGANAP